MTWQAAAFNPFTLRAAKTGLAILGIFYSQKQHLDKNLNEKCLSEATQKLSLKYFANFRLIPKLFSKVW